jgi:hypothetical protein
MRPHVEDVPQIRGLVGLDNRGLLPAEAMAPEWLDPKLLYQTVADAGIFVRGEPGHDKAGCLGGYVIEVSLPAKGPRLLLTAAGPEVSNDHHPFYEVVFRREGTRLIQERKRVTFFDIAGVEGAEWPVLHATFVVLFLLLAGVAWGVLSTAQTLMHWIEWRRPTRR